MLCRSLAGLAASGSTCWLPARKELACRPVLFTCAPRPVAHCRAGCHPGLQLPSGLPAARQGDAPGGGKVGRREEGGCTGAQQRRTSAAGGCQRALPWPPVHGTFSRRLVGAAGGRTPRAQPRELSPLPPCSTAATAASATGTIGKLQRRRRTFCARTPPRSLRACCTGWRRWVGG